MLFCCIIKCSESVITPYLLATRLGRDYHVVLLHHKMFHNRSNHNEILGWPDPLKKVAPNLIIRKWENRRMRPKEAEGISRDNFQLTTKASSTIAAAKSPPVINQHVNDHLITLREEKTFWRWNHHNGKHDTVQLRWPLPKIGPTKLKENRKFWLNKACDSLTRGKRRLAKKNDWNALDLLIYSRLMFSDSLF